MIRSLAMTALLALTVCAACGREAPPTQKVAAPTQSQSAARHQSAAPAQSSAATTPQSETEQAAAAQESADTTDEDRSQARSDVSLEHLAALPESAQLPSGKWKPGVNYVPLVPAQPTNVGPGKIEVVEVIWLGCPHCYALEPYIQAWAKSKPDYIQFVRVPVMWGPVHRAHARLFYTLQALGRSDLIEKAFDTIQQQHQLLVGNTEDETLKLEEAWAQQQGVKPEDFAKAYNSFGVNADLQRAEQLTERYHVEGVPLVVINGKYTTDVGKAGGPQELISLINDLAAAEHTNKGRS